MNDPVKLAFTPYAHQRAAHALRLAIRFLVLVWHRRAGKTVFAVVELILAALVCALARPRYGYIAPLLKQAKAIAWDYLKFFTRAIPGCVYNESELSCTLPNGAVIRLFGADNPDSFRGLYFDGVVVDEPADIKPNLWGEVLRPALADRQGWAIFIGTAKGINLFSQLYYFALKQEDGWAGDLRRASETGVIPAEEIEAARRAMSPQQFAQEFDCDFAAATVNALIALDQVLEAQKRVVGPAEFIYAAKILGVDVARYGDDRTVIFPRQGVVAMRPKAFHGLNVMEVSGQVAMAIDRWKPNAVFIDQGGVGGGVVDALRDLGHDVTGVDFGQRALDPRYENKRIEMWEGMADWVRGGGCLPDDEGLAAELTAPTFTYANARGRKQMESKDDMRKRGLPSPDKGDALALTFAFPVAAPSAQTARSRRQVRHEYDPFDDGADRSVVTSEYDVFGGA